MLSDAEGVFFAPAKISRLGEHKFLWCSVRVRGKLHKSLTSRTGHGPCFSGDLSAVRLAWVATYNIYQYNIYIYNII